jgi:hypothetical protein
MGFQIFHDFLVPLFLCHPQSGPPLPFHNSARFCVNEGSYESHENRANAGTIPFGIHVRSVLDEDLDNFQAPFAGSSHEPGFVAGFRGANIRSLGQKSRIMLATDLRIWLHRFRRRIIVGQCLREGPLLMIAFDHGADGVVCSSLRKRQPLIRHRCKDDGASDGFDNLSQADPGSGSIRQPVSCLKTTDNRDIAE